MSKDPKWLCLAAQRARLEAWTLGRLLSRLCELENKSDPDLATELGCDLHTVHWLYLCRAPSHARFAEGIEQIAQRFRLDASRLAGLIRRADAVVAFAGHGYYASESEFLLAARDRGNDEDSR